MYITKVGLFVTVKVSVEMDSEGNGQKWMTPSEQNIFWKSRFNGPRW